MTTLGPRQLARLIMCWCQEHHIPYRHASSFSGIERPASKHDLRTPNGMLYHAPKRMGMHHAMSEEHCRVYLLWYDESFDMIKESFAFLKLRGPQELYLVNCKRRKKP